MASPFARLVQDYASAPVLVRRAVADMSSQQLLARPVPGKWSTLEVVCHLLDSDQAYAHRMKRVIAEDRPLLIGYDETRFTGRLYYHERNLGNALDLMEATRNDMASILDQLPESAWRREGVHNERGLETLEDQVKIEIEHVAHHLRHVSEKRRALGLPELA